MACSSGLTSCRTLAPRPGTSSSARVWRRSSGCRTSLASRPSNISRCKESCATDGSSMAKLVASDDETMPSSTVLPAPTACVTASASTVSSTPARRSAASSGVSASSAERSNASVPSSGSSGSLKFGEMCVPPSSNTSTFRSFFEAAGLPSISSISGAGVRKMRSNSLVWSIGSLLKRTSSTGRSGRYPATSCSSSSVALGAKSSTPLETSRSRGGSWPSSGAYRSATRSLPPSVEAAPSSPTARVSKLARSSEISANDESLCWSSAASSCSAKRPIAGRSSSRVQSSRHNGTAPERLCALKEISTWPRKRWQ
mmetsp:Transcript_41452/g.81994  ORF Transcript_41452/g.81994 Transcript_41452/m.81994 type:complete len:313 (+) Transcript_41452:819-1757(+)